MTARMVRTAQIAGAFVRMGFLEEISYPLAFALSQLHTIVPILTYFFIGKLVGEGELVAGDYFTFAAIGALTIRLMHTALADLGQELDRAIQQGRFESLLVEPIRWRALPFALVQWPIVSRSVIVGVVIFLTVPLGATYQWSGVPMALLLTFSGMAATLAIGIVAMSVKVLSKRSDPILSVYQLLVHVLAGAVFPLELLPAPLRAISWLLPQTYVIAGNRAALMPGGAGLGGPTPLQALVFLLVFAAVGYVSSLWLLGRSMQYARRTGLLGGY